jgi:hypothetical protein
MFMARQICADCGVVLDNAHIDVIPRRWGGETFCGPCRRAEMRLDFDLREIDLGERHDDPPGHGGQKFWRRVLGDDLY